MEKIVPDCSTAAGCLIPPLWPEGSRAMELWHTLSSLKELGVSGVYAESCGCDADDLRMVGVIQEFISSRNAHSSVATEGDYHGRS